MNKKLLALLFFMMSNSFETQAIRTTFVDNFSLGPVSLQTRYTTNISAYVYASVTAAILAIKIGYDWSWHDDYVQQSSHVFKNFLNYVRIHNITSLKDPYLYKFFTAMNFDFCLTYEAWLRNSYDSWLKPWNWTARQKHAYEKMEILSMIALHGPMISLDECAIDRELEGYARKYCTAVSEYPLVYYGNQIDSHLAAIKKGFSIKNTDIQRIIMELEQELYKLKYILRGNKSYIDECHTLKTHQLLQQAARNR